MSADLPPLGPVRELPKKGIDLPALPIKDTNKLPPLKDELPPSRMLLPGTPDEATENDYVVALGAKILQHACRVMPMKVKIAGGGYQKRPMFVINEHALAHVLKVFFGDGEVNDETLAWKPEFEEHVPSSVEIKDA